MPLKRQPSRAKPHASNHIHIRRCRLQYHRKNIDVAFVLRRRDADVAPSVHAVRPSLDNVGRWRASPGSDFRQSLPRFAKRGSRRACRPQMDMRTRCVQHFFAHCQKHFFFVVFSFLSGHLEVFLYSFRLE